MHLKLQNSLLNFLITVAKTCETVLRLNMASATKVKVEYLQSLWKSHITKQLLTLLSTLKNDIHLGLAASVNYHFFG